MRVAINGFGRIGRAVFKIGLDRNVNFVAINDLSKPEILAYLLKHDTIYGKYDKKVEFGKDFLEVNGKKVRVISEPEPTKLPWKELKVDVVVESTGRFRRKEDALKHIEAGAKKILISAPGKDSVDITVVPCVNHDKLRKGHKIISVASCTTNCLAPLVKVLDDNFKIEKGFMTTVHAYTNDQKILDVAHDSLRRARAAALNIIPTTSGATDAAVEAIPHLKGKIDGVALRVPVGCGSIVDFVAIVKKKVDVNMVNNALKKAAKGKFKNVIEYSEEELVSSDIIGNSHSSIVDGKLTQVMGDMIKVLAWYDNEYGYSCRMVDVIKMLK